MSCLCPRYPRGNRALRAKNTAPYSFKNIGAKVRENWTKQRHPMTLAKKSEAPKKILPKKMRINSKTVYVGNLNYERDEDGVKALFKSFGHVGAVFVIKDPKTKKSKGIAFVKMPAGKDALRAIDELNGKIVDGRRLKVSEALESKTFVPKMQVVEEEKAVEIIPVIEKKIKRPVSKKAKKSQQGLSVLFKYLKKQKQAPAD